MSEPITEMDAWKVSDYCLHLKAKDSYFEAFVKLDGCVDLSFSPTMDGNFDEGCHICDLPLFIERLQAIHAKAKKHFGEEFNQ